MKILYFEPFRLDLADERLWHSEQEVRLTAKAFAVLRYLVEHTERLVSRDDLLEAAWGTPYVTEAALAACIREIRRALDDSARHPKFVQTVRGRGYRFLASVTVVQQGADAEPTPPAEPAALRIVGREAELAQLSQRWARALQGERQMLLITGEAGIGKTALVDAFAEQLAAEGRFRIGQGQCIEQYGAGEAYLPLLEVLGQWGRGADGPDLVELLKQQAPNWLLQLPALVPDTAFDLLQRRAGGATRERMLRELVEALESLAAQRPLVLILEDLHWSDASTLEWLRYMARRRQHARLLVLGTYRSVDAVVHDHPVRLLAQELQLHQPGTELVLDHLSEASVSTYLKHRFEGHLLPDEWGRILHQRSNGNPLFLVTLINDLVQRHAPQGDSTSWVLPPNLDELVHTIPMSLQRLIEHQVVQLPSDHMVCLEVASVAGKEFAAAVVSTAVDRTIEAVEACFDVLARDHQLVRSSGIEAWPNGTASTRYGFIHDLYRETLYSRIPMNRKVRWHQQLGQQLEAGYGPRARERAAELAEHFVCGRDSQRAVYYLQLAGENALRRSAHQEAIVHLTKGMDILRTLSNTPERTQQELMLSINLAVALVATQGQGAAEVEHILKRARDLCQQVGETPQLLPVLWGLFRFYFARAQFEIARELAEQIMRLATQTQEPAHLLEAHRGLGATWFCLGDFSSARDHMEQSLALYDPHQHQSHAFLYGQDPSIVCHCYLSWTLWFLGYPAQALTRIEEALRQAHTLSHPHTLAFALTGTASLYQLRHEPQFTRAPAETAVTLSVDQGFMYHRALGTILCSWARGMQGETELGIDQLSQGLTDYRATGADVLCTYFYCLLVEVYGQAGQLTAELEMLDDIQTRMAKTGELFYAAEYLRLRGECLLQLSVADHAAAESCFHQAITVAQHQQAKSLELRAAMSLARLWQHQGKRYAARRLLGDVYGWFTEGFDTHDLKAAKALLEALI